MERFCKKCQTTKSLTEFSVLKRTYKDKVYTCYQNACKPCVVAHIKAWREKQPKHTNRAQDWKRTKSPVTWETFKGHETTFEYKTYPTHECGRRYLQQLGCLICKRDALILTR